MSVTETSQTEETEAKFDGLVIIGKLVGVREVRRSKGDNSVIEGMANIDFDSSRGIESIQANKTLKTMMGTFDKSAVFFTLTNPENVGKYYIVAIGKNVSGAFTNYVALEVKEY